MNNSIKWENVDRKCEQCAVIKSVQHVLMECTYTQKRAILNAAIEKEKV